MVFLKVILSGNRLVLFCVILAAIISKIPALGTWWCLDDWGQLAKAAGTIAGSDTLPARWLSQHFYWNITYPLFGLYVLPYTLSRILLHAIASLTVAKIGRNAGLGKPAYLVAGLLFAASPMAFTVIYWASGIQELLAGVFALLAVERWYVQDRSSIILPVLFGVCSILSKESGLALPVLFLISFIWQWKNKGQIKIAELVGILILFVFSVMESVLVWKHFSTGLNEPYHTGGILVVLGNLGKFGWWLSTQKPVFTGQVTWTLARIGIGFFSVWFLWAIFSIRRKVYLPIFTAIAAVLSVTPALGLIYQVRPYMGYLAMACLALSVGCFWPKKWNPKTQKPHLLFAMVMMICFSYWGAWSMDYRIGRQDESGLPADPIVRATVLAQESFASFNELIEAREKGEAPPIAIFQQPLRKLDITRAKRLGPEFVNKSLRHSSLAGEIGLSLLSGSSADAFWVNSLMEVPSDAYVFCETPSGFEFWGTTRNALLNATLVNIFIGNYDRAQRQLTRAAEIDNQFESYEYDSELLKLPASILRLHSAVFLELLFDDKAEVSGLGVNGVDGYELFVVLLTKLAIQP